MKDRSTIILRFPDEVRTTQFNEKEVGSDCDVTIVSSGNKKMPCI